LSLSSEVAMVVMALLVAFVWLFLQFLMQVIAQRREIHGVHEDLKRRGMFSFTVPPNTNLCSKVIAFRSGFWLALRRTCTRF